MSIHRRGFLSGLATTITTPAIVHAGNIIPVKIYEVHPDILFSRTVNPQTTVHWRFHSGAEIVCPSGRKIYEIIRLGDRGQGLLEPSRSEEPVTIEIVRYPKDGVFFKNVHSVSFTYMEDGVLRHGREINNHCPHIRWSYSLSPITDTPLALHPL